MDWSNERYVRLYTRDTATWKLFSWEARFVLTMLFRKVDRAGVLDVGRAGIRGLAAVIEVPLDITERGLVQLLDGDEDNPPTIVRNATQFVIPNFLDAQEAHMSDTQRKRDSREKRRALSLRGQTTTVTPGHEDSEFPDNMSRGVTDGPADGQKVTRGHTESHAVTPSLPDPILAKPSESPARAPARSSQQGSEPTQGAGPDRETQPPEPSAEPEIAGPPPLAISATIAQAPSARMGRADRAAMGTPEALADPSRDRWCTKLWDELNEARARIAAKHGLEARALHPQDDGRRELAFRARDGYTRDDLAHVLAVIAAEADDTRSLKWLGGAMWSKRRVDNAIARSVADAKTSASATPSRQTDDGLRPMPGPPRVSDEPQVDNRGAPAIGTVDMSPEAVAKRAEERAAKIAALVAKTAAERANSVPLGGES